MEHVTMLSPDSRPGAVASGISSGFPTDLLGQSAQRLRVVAFLYAFVFFMAGILPALLFAQDRAQFFSSFVQWGPAVVGIVVALIVALSTADSPVGLLVQHAQATPAPPAIARFRGR